MAHTFETFKRQVDQELLTRIGLTTADLPDIDFYSLFLGGVDARETAMEVLLAADADEAMIAELFY